MYNINEKDEKYQFRERSNVPEMNYISNINIDQLITNTDINSIQEYVEVKKN